MSRRCDLSFKGPLFGNNVSHANNKTRRVFNSNVHKVSVFSKGLAKFITLKLSAAGMRTLDKYGGLDNFVQAKSLSKLSEPLQSIKRRLVKKSKNDLSNVNLTSQTVSV